MPQEKFGKPRKAIGNYGARLEHNQFTPDLAHDRRHLARIRDNHVTGPGWKRLFWKVVRRIIAKEKTFDEEPS